MNTQNNQKKKSKWIRAIRPIAFVLVLVVLLGYSTYAWMKRDWTPTLREENVRIVAGSSLVFEFGNDQVKDTAINELAGMGEFVFKSVSNSTGKSGDFFALNYHPNGEYFDSFKHLSTDEISEADFIESGALNKEMLLGKRYGYVELTFKVKTELGENDTDKLVRLHKDSCIKGSEKDAEGNPLSAEAKAKNANAALAMRVSISVFDGDTETDTFIYSPRADGNGAPTHTGITNRFADGIGYVADGATRYDYDVDNKTATLAQVARDGSPLKITPTGVKALASSTENENDVNETLFRLNKGETKTIVVRIWLEGEDADCTDDKVLGGELDLLLKFEAIEAVQN